MSDKQFLTLSQLKEIISLMELNDNSIYTTITLGDMTKPFNPDKKFTKRMKKELKNGVICADMEEIK